LVLFAGLSQVLAGALGAQFKPHPLNAVMAEETCGWVVLNNRSQQPNMRPSVAI